MHTPKESYMVTEKEKHTKKIFLKRRAKRYTEKKMYTEKDEGDWGNDLTELDIQRHS